MNFKMIIEENASGSDSSFIGKLHEEGVWDIKAFWLVYEAINQLTVDTGNAAVLDRELAKRVSKIGSYVLNSVAQSFDPNDLFKIKNLDKMTLRDFIERLNQ